MVRDVVFAAFAFAVLCAFLGILLWKVPRLDLFVVLAMTAGLTAYDFFLGPHRAGS